MKIYTTQQEIEADIKDGVLAIEGDVKFECSFTIDASIVVRGNIDAHNIDAFDLTAYNIDAFDLTAYNINAHNISYYAFCNVYFSIECESIKARRPSHSKPVCLDGKLTITPKAPTKEMTLAEVSALVGTGGAGGGAGAVGGSGAVGRAVGGSGAWKRYHIQRKDC